MRKLCVLILAAGWLTIAYAGDRDIALLREQGLLEYDQGHYAAAVILFQRAADAGDVRSAEILALMYRFGPQFYGDQVTVDAAKSALCAAMAADRRHIDTASPLSASR